MICIFEKYKNIFGKPNKGLHKFRIINTAAIDYILTIIIAIITSYFTNLPLVLSTIIWFIIGIIMHLLFCVKTNITKYFLH